MNWWIKNFGKNRIIAEILHLICKSTKTFNQNKCLLKNCQKHFGIEISVKKIFLIKKMVLNFLVIQNFGQKKFDVKKNWGKKNVVQRKFWYKNFLLKKFDQKNFGQKKIVKKKC